jgi:hypothetical protein
MLYALERRSVRRCRDDWFERHPRLGVQSHLAPIFSREPLTLTRAVLLPATAKIRDRPTIDVSRPDRFSIDETGADEMPFRPLSAARNFEPANVR